MKSTSGEKDFLDDFDSKNLEDYPPKVLRKMVRQLLSERSRKPGDSSEASDEAAEEEREKLADLHAEKKGAVPSIPVKESDLPVELASADEEEDEEEEGEECEDCGAKAVTPKSKKTKNRA